MTLEDCYVYAYLDPRKKGEFVYGDLCFDHEPFYIGKGINGRCNHFKKHNIIVRRKSEKICASRKVPIIEKIAKGISESTAFDIESNLIKLIGRMDLNQGPLANLTDGGEGLAGHVQSEETKRIRGQKSKEWHRKMKGTEAYSERTKNQSIQIKQLRSDENSIYNTDEYKEKHRKANKPIIFTPEVREKQSNAHKRNWATPGHPIASKEAQCKRTGKIKLAWENPTSKYFLPGYKEKKNAKIKEAWALPEMREKRCKEWVVISPEGKEFPINDLETFCKQNNLYADALRKVAYGRLRYYKHWKCRRA